MPFSVEDVRVLCHTKYAKRIFGQLNGAEWVLEAPIMPPNPNYAIKMHVTAANVPNSFSHVGDDKRNSRLIIVSKPLELKDYSNSFDTDDYLEIELDTKDGHIANTRDYFESLETLERQINTKIISNARKHPTWSKRAFLPQFRINHKGYPLMYTREVFMKDNSNWPTADRGTPGTEPPELQSPYPGTEDDQIVLDQRQKISKGLQGSYTLYTLPATDLTKIRSQYRFQLPTGPTILTPSEWTVQPAYANYRFGYVPIVLPNKKRWIACVNIIPWGEVSDYTKEKYALADLFANEKDTPVSTNQDHWLILQLCPPDGSNAITAANFAPAHTMASGNVGNVGLHDLTWVISKYFHDTGLITCEEDIYNTPIDGVKAAMWASPSNMDATLAYEYFLRLNNVTDVKRLNQEGQYNMWYNHRKNQLGLYHSVLNADTHLVETKATFTMNVEEGQPYLESNQDKEISKDPLTYRPETNNLPMMCHDHKTILTLLWDGLAGFVQPGLLDKEDYPDFSFLPFMNYEYKVFTEYDTKTPGYSQFNPDDTRLARLIGYTKYQYSPSLNTPHPVISDYKQQYEGDDSTDLKDVYVYKGLGDFTPLQLSEKYLQTYRYVTSAQAPADFTVVRFIKIHTNLNVNAVDVDGSTQKIVSVLPCTTGHEMDSNYLYANLHQSQSYTISDTKIERILFYLKDDDNQPINVFRDWYVDITFSFEEPYPMDMYQGTRNLVDIGTRFTTEGYTYRGFENVTKDMQDEMDRLAGSESKTRRTASILGTKRRHAPGGF